MVKDSTSRRQRKDWAARTAAKLHGHRRRPQESPPPQRTGIQTYTSDLPPADADDLAERRALAQPREREAERAYQRLARVCLDEPQLSAGIWMRCPEEPGETWRDREPTVHPSPICLPQEHIGARQFAAEWALLWGEASAWASLQIEPRRDAVLDDEDHDFLLELTGNLPSMIVSNWCNAILAGKGKRRQRPQREHDGGGSWDNVIRAMEDGHEEM